MNPVKPSFKTELLPLFLVVASFALSFYFYAHFPESVPTHWNWAGEADGYSSKAVGAFLFPTIIAGIYLLFLVLPYLDPKKERYTEFRKVYHIFKHILVLFMFVMFVLAGLNGLGIMAPIGKVVPVLVGLMFILMGNYMGKIRYNWLMGIRTPWTLSSEEVWNKTHRLGGKLFMLGGLMIATTPLFPPTIGIILFVTAILLASVMPMAYSYVLFARTKDKTR